MIPQADPPAADVRCLDSARADRNFNAFRAIRLLAPLAGARYEEAARASQVSVEDIRKIIRGEKPERSYSRNLTFLLAYLGMAEGRVLSDRVHRWDVGSSASRLQMLEELLSSGALEARLVVADSSLAGTRHLLLGDNGAVVFITERSLLATPKVHALLRKAFPKAHFVSRPIPRELLSRMGQDVLAPRNFQQFLRGCLPAPAVKREAPGAEDSARVLNYMQLHGIGAEEAMAMLSAFSEKQAGGKG